MTENITKIEDIVYLQYALESFKLCFTIMNAAYVMGMLWIITCGIHEEFVQDGHQHDLDDPSINQRYFLNDFEI